MRKILITGAGSFIGTSFENYRKNHANYDAYEISVMDTLTGKKVGDETEDTWNFAGFDVVFHVAGIAHVDPKPELAPLYYKVNRDLTIEVAKEAKEKGVKDVGGHVTGAALQRGHVVKRL